MKQIPIQDFRNNDLKSIELQGSLLAKNLKFKDLNLDSKTFHYWKMNGLIGTVDQTKWAQLSFVEYIWIKVLQTMRQFHCSLKLMQNIYQNQFIRAYEENLYKNTLEDNLAYYYNIRKIRSLEANEAELLRQHENTLNDPLIMMALRTEVSYFYQLILTCINSGNETGFVIYADQTFEVLDGTKKELNFDKPYLLIPLSPLIATIFSEKDKDQLINSTGILNEQELWIIKELRNQNIEKLTIFFNSENKKILKVEYDSSKLLDPNKSKDIMRRLGMQNYSSIKLSTRNGTTLTYNKTEKKYFK